MDERPMDPEVDAVIEELVSAGPITVATAPKATRRGPTEIGVQVSNQVAMCDEDDGLALLKALLDDDEGGTASP
jgi:hypothetical protein